jgi:hypothetical protein
LPAYADVIESTSGQKLEGTITKESGTDITLDVDGLELTLKRAEIKAIRKGPVPKKKKEPVTLPEEVKDDKAVTGAPGLPAPAGAEEAIDLNKFERPVIVFDKRDWKLVSQNVKNQVVLAQFLPDGDTLQDWSELVTAQLYIGLRTEPRYYVQYVKEKTAATCPGVKWQVLRETPYDVTYEWSVKSCSNIPDQSEIARVILGTDGLHILRYSMKIGEMPADNREKWIGCLEASQIVKPEVKP